MSKKNALAVLSSLDLFAGLSKSELNKVAKLTTSSTIPAGTEFIKEGSTGREAFIVTSGKGTVRKGGRVVAGIGPNDIVGEMAVVAGIERTASVVADTEMKVEVLSRNEFMSLMDAVPSIPKKIMVAALKRLQTLEPSLG